MASVDDVLNQVNRSDPTGNPTTSKKLRVEELTEVEKDGLREQGYDVDSSDFVDIELDSGVLTDDKAAQKAKAVEDLLSVTKAPPPVEQPSPVESTLSQLEYNRMKQKLEEADKLLETIPSSCNRCGWPITEKVTVEPTKEDIKDFLRAVMGGEVYTKTYTIFGDSVKVSFRTRTGLEDTVIRETIRKLYKEGEILRNTDLLAQIRRFNFACSLALYETPQVTKKFSEPLVKESGSKDSALRSGFFISDTEEKINQLPSQLIGVLMRQFDDFNELVDHLMAKVNDVGFWKGTES